MAITGSRVDSFMSGYAAELCETTSSRQENQRLDLPRVFLEVTIEGIQTHVRNACVELVFNCDEIGMREWEDRVKLKVLVPSAMREQKIFHGIHRGLKCISVGRCI
jgi:hypothetical protein